MSLLRLFLLMACAAPAFAADISVAGAVESPGPLRLQNDEGVIAVILRAGGLGALGCTEVVVQRAAEKNRAQKINLWELMAEFQPDALLAPGDVVIVPQHPVSCLRDVKALNALLADYVKARANSPSAPTGWKERLAAKIGGDGQRIYDGARRGVREGK